MAACTLESKKEVFLSHSPTCMHFECHFPLTPSQMYLYPLRETIASLVAASHSYSSSSDLQASSLLLLGWGLDSALCLGRRWGQLSGYAPCALVPSDLLLGLSRAKAHRQAHQPRRCVQVGVHCRLGLWHVRLVRRGGRAWLLVVRGLFRRRLCRLRCWAC